MIYVTMYLTKSEEKSLSFDSLWLVAKDCESKAKAKEPKLSMITFIQRSCIGGSTNSLYKIVLTKQMIIKDMDIVT